MCGYVGRLFIQWLHCCVINDNNNGNKFCGNKSTRDFFEGMNPLYISLCECPPPVCKKSSEKIEFR